MDYFDMILDMASGEGEIDPTEARAVLNGAERQLNQLKEQVSERLPDDTEAGGDVDRRRKSKSEYSRQERAEFYEECRQKNLDPNEEWAKLPE